MARKYTYGHGGETDVISMTDQMHEAKEIVGAKKWDSLSQEERKNLTKYLVMKGEIEGEGEDYYYAKGGVTKRGMNSKIKDWYIKKYPTDELGEEINDGLTFKGLWASMNQGYDVYDVIEVHDSIVRERIFEHLSEVLGVDYNVVYNKWLGDKYADGGMMAKGGKPEPKPLSDSALKKLEGFQERKRARGEQTEGTLVARVIENQYKRRNEPKVIHTQFEEEDFEYADGGMMADGGGVGSYKQHKIGDYVEVWQPMGRKTKSMQIIGFEDDRNTYVLKDGNSKSYTPKKYIANLSGEFPLMADGGMMAKGGVTKRGMNSKIKDWYIKKYPTDELGEEINDGLTFSGLWASMNQGYDVYDVIEVHDSIVRERIFEHLSEILGVDYNVVYNKWLGDKYADGGMMAKGGMMAWGGKMAHGGKTRTRHRKQTLEEKAMESVGSATWFQLDKETQAGVIADMLSIGALPQRMAKGAKVAENKEFSVTYELLDGKKVTEKYESQEAMDDGIANFYIMNDVKDAIVGGAKEPEVVKEEVKEVKKEEKPKKKGLFDVEKAAPKVSKSKETAPIVHVDGLEKEIQRYDELKAVIKNAEAEKEVIGGVIKDVAKDKYLEVYEQQGKRPTTIIIESGGTEIGYTVLDKYKIVTPEKETVLKEYDGLLGTDYTFTFDNEILDKEGKNGEKIADIINDLIENSEDIPDDLKSKLVKITKKVGVKKGSIERLLAYDSPSEILQVIEPVEMLK